MNEAQTRLDLIDPALKAAGWGVVEESRIRVEFPITQGRLIGQGRRAQPLEADYILEYRNKRLAVVEAKADEKGYTEGVGQAKDYAGRLDIRHAYSTNGRKIYGIDMEEGTEGDVAKFPTPAELWEMTFPAPAGDGSPTEEARGAQALKTRLDSVPFALFRGKYQPRYFQRVATERTLDAIAAGKNRLLLTLATGTGKTAIAFHICWKLFHAKWNLRRDGSRTPRVLFLADRNILADQAFNSFGEFEEEALVRITPFEIRKKGSVPKNGSIFFTIFQSFMAGGVQVETEEDDQWPRMSPAAAPTAPRDALPMAAEEEIPYNPPRPHFGEYPPDFFDLIIIDECHRGGARDESRWRGILEHFSPAVQIGLTATPKRDVNADTYAYFGEPLYTYALKDGINDGFLTPFKVKEIDTTIDDYIHTPGDTVEEGEVIEGREYPEEEFNRSIEIRQREEYRVKLFLDLIDQNQKTLVFCATQPHAAMVRDLINQHAKNKNPDYCHRVTADDGEIGETHLRDFQDNEKTIPTILTTSQKLSTGVDAPEIRNIVLLRPVKSMIEFKQIIGRGTRLFGGKDHFTIYDFVDAHEHFQDPEWDGEPIEPDPPGPDGEPRPCPRCGEIPCACPPPEPEPCPECRNIPCACDNPPRQMVKITLSDGTAREIDHMVKTTFWDPSGVPIRAEQFLRQLYGDLPTLFGSEEELREVWSLPGTRRKLLEELSEKGYSSAQLEGLRKIVHGEDSDLFDVLNYIAHHRDLVPRLERAEQARIHFSDYHPKQQEFLNFVLKQYVRAGVGELDDQKLPELLELKYQAIADAKSELGDLQAIRDTFIGFQQHLYHHGAKVS